MGIRGFFFCLKKDLTYTHTVPILVFIEAEHSHLKESIMANETQTLFNFDCHAVLSVDTNDNMEEGEPDSPEMLGFWLTRGEAEAAIEALKNDRIRKNDVENKARHKKYGWRERSLSTMHYFIVPLKEMKGSYLSDIENQLEKAAELQMSGIGVVA